MSDWLRDLWCSLFGHAPLEVTTTRSILIATTHKPTVLVTSAWCPRCGCVICGKAWLLSRGLAEEVK